MAGKKLASSMSAFQTSDQTTGDSDTLSAIESGFTSLSVSDAETTPSIKTTFEQNNAYLLNPHSAVEVSAAISLKNILPDQVSACKCTNPTGGSSERAYESE